MSGITEKQSLKGKSRHSCIGSRLGSLSNPGDLTATTHPSLADGIGDFLGDGTEGILFALALAVELRDKQTGGHCERLASMSVALALTLGLSRARVVALYRGGYLHDVGKVGIPDSILLKPGSLTADEWETMRSHTVIGEDICRPLKTLAPVLPIIRHHHERWDGSGYPDGLKGEEIPLLARILQIVDIYDALVSPRPYKKAYSPDQALSLIQEETDRGWRDPRIVAAFVEFHKNLLPKLLQTTGDGGPDMEGMRTSLGNLRNILSSEFAPIPVD